MLNLLLIVIEIADSIVDLGQGKSVNAGNFFRVFACLEEQDDVAHTSTSTFNDRLTAIDGRISNNVGMCCTFNCHMLHASLLYFFRFLAWIIHLLFIILYSKTLRVKPTKIGIRAIEKCSFAARAG